MAKTTIPLHHLNNDSGIGLFIHRIDQIGDIKNLRTGAHRDDHGNFFFQENGSTCMMVDFREVRLDGCGVFCVLPGQVHAPAAAEGGRGWFIAVDMALLDEQHRLVVEEYSRNAVPVAITSEQSDLLGRSLALLLEFYKSGDDCKRPLLRSMLTVCLGIFVSFFEQTMPLETGQSRPVAIYRQFRQLLAKHFKTIKSPSGYSAILNITPAYLNEVVKEVSGQPVSYWIQNEVMMEAKRLLYYTDLNVKEIAFDLGYEDHAYFSRLFRKVAGNAPGKFREEYRR
jgi:AraC-like DNA-binding protein